MICEHCRYEADMVTLVSRLKGPKFGKGLHESYREQKMGHDQCQGCDCQHKHVGAWRGE
jgi:hypothetical protein